MLVKIGTNREDLDTTRVLATTFHPTKDIWWVVYELNSGALLLTITDKVVSGIEEFASVKRAMDRFLTVSAGREHILFLRNV